VISSSDRPSAATPNFPRDDGRGEHQARSEHVAGEQLIRLAGVGDRTEQRRRAGADERGKRVEHRDRRPAELERKQLADGQG